MIIIIAHALYKWLFFYHRFHKASTFDRKIEPMCVLSLIFLFASWVFSAAKLQIEEIYLAL